MKRSFCLGTIVVAAFLCVTNAEDAAKSKMRIIPGQVIVPKEEVMRRIWEEGAPGYVDVVEGARRRSHYFRKRWRCLVR
jgi:hypothetical protein